MTHDDTTHDDMTRVDMTRDDMRLHREAEKRHLSLTTIGTIAALVSASATVLLVLSRVKAEKKTVSGTQTPTHSTPPTSGGAPPAVPHDEEFGEVQFPVPNAPQQWEQLQALATRAEEVTGMTGLYSYLLATADRESNAVPSAMNTSTDGAPAFTLFCRSMNYDGRYKNNPWRPKVCDASDPLAARWAYSGGLFGMMPATALATRDKRGHRHDPARVFDPPFAVAYAADLAMRLRTGSGAKTWGDIRGGWALLNWAKSDSTATGKARVIERFNENLRAVASMGADPDLATKNVDASKYPGFTATLHYLLQSANAA